MNVTFVENAQDDVDGDECCQNQDRLVGERAQESGGGALEGGLNAWRHSDFIFDFVNGVDGVTESGIGCKIERKRHHRELPLVIDGQSRAARFKAGERAERNLRRRGRSGRRGGRGDRGAGSRRRRLAARRMHINVFRVLLELRVHFQDDVVLIQLRENGGDQALAESVVERVVYIGGKNSEARSGIAIDGEHREQALVLLVAGDITQLGQRFEFVHEARDPIGQLLGVHVLQAVLKLRAADAVFDGEVLHRLHEERYPVHLGERGLKAADYVGGRNPALAEGLEVDLDTAAVESRVDPVNADERGEALDRRVLQDHVGQGALPAHHGRERNVLRTFGNAKNHAGVLHREEALGHVDVKKNGADQRCGGDDKRGGAKAQHKFQRAAIKRDDGIKDVLRFAVEPALIFFLLMAQQLGGHHGRQGQRNEGRNDDGDREGYRKFAEQTAHDVAHEQQRNEHGDQGHGQRKNGEADLLGAFERGLQGRLAFFYIAGNVFDHNDGIVDHEAGGNGEGHERKIIEAVAQQVHHPEGAHNREGHGKTGNDRGANAAQEQEDDQHDEHDGQHQRELHVRNGSANSGGTVSQYFHAHRGGQRSLQLRQQFLDAVDHRDDVGAGLALNIQDDRRSLVGPGSLLHVLHAIQHGGHVGQPDGRAIAISDDQRSVAIARNELIVCANRVGLMRTVESSFGLVHVGLRQRRAQIFEA